jgi:TonB-linked SusC/RagA family outer membrane protein
MCQPLTLKGKVINEQGSPIPGATITLKRPLTPNAKHQTPNSAPSSVISHLSSDANGEFSLTNLHLNDTLLISAIGYEPYTIIYDHTYSRYPSTTVLLKRKLGLLDEVIVNTGYQQLPKERATGSFAVAGKELLARSVSTNILDRLEGLTPSLLFDRRVADDHKIQLRGLSTLSTTISAPLVVLDNFPFSGDINSINPADVESITLLKDAAAASIWGARAGNGVIVITTKRGGYSQPATLTVSSAFTRSPKPALFDAAAMSAADFIGVEQFLFDRGFYDDDIANTTTRPALTPVVELLARRRAGLITAEEAEAALDGLRRQDVRKDMLRYLYRPAALAQYDLALSGGSPVFRYRFSAGFNRNAASLVGNNTSRLTLRTDNTFKPLKNLEFSLSVAYTDQQGTANSPGGWGDYRTNIIRTLYPYAKLAGEAGEPLSIDARYRGGYTDTTGGGQLLSWKYYPLQELAAAENSITSEQWIANLGFRYSLSAALSLELKYQYATTHTGRESYYSTETFFTRDLVNQFTVLTATGPRYNIPMGGILDARTGFQKGSAGRAQLNFNKAWGVHHLSALAGAEIRQERGTARAGRTYGYNPDQLTFTNVDFVTRFPVYGGLASARTIPAAAGMEETVNRFVSLFANTAYTFKERYTLTASARRDASNIFGVNTNQKGVPLWSVGGLWKLSGEPFYRVAGLPYLALRTTYGYSGNTNPAVSAVATLRYSSASGSPVNLPYAALNTPPNKDLRWEKVGMFNAGVDFRLKGSRLSGSLEYYHKSSIDLLEAESLDPTTGLSLMTTNSASLAGRGVDLVLNLSLLETKDIAWKTVFNGSYAQYKVTRYRFNLSRNGFTSNGTFINPLVGEHPYALVSFRWAGLDGAGGHPQGIQDGQLSQDYNALTALPLDQQVVGRPALPPVFGNWLHTVSWKTLSLSANITWRLGGAFRRPTINYTALFSNHEGHPDFARRWQKAGDEAFTDVPSMLYPAVAARDNFYAYSAATVEKAGAIRLQDLRLAWSPARIKTVKNVQLFAMAASLNHLLWKESRLDIDPDFPAGLRPPPSFSLGLTITP